MPKCLLGLGSNLGDSARLLSEAVARLQSHPQIEVLRQSRVRETSPVGGPAGQAAYLNAAAVVRTSLSPHELLKECQEIEDSLGRRREVRWGPRTIDLDLLLYDDLVLNEPDLQIPHPRMAWRRFVLEPAAEIAAEMVHAVIGWTIGRLHDNLNSTPWYLAIGGPLGGNKNVATGVSERIGARLLVDPFDLVWQRNFCHRDPPSNMLRIELEFLQHRMRVLDQTDPVWASLDRPTVSNFWSESWFGRSAVLAGNLLSPGEYADYMAVWNELRRRIVRPRLLAIDCGPIKSLRTLAQTRGSSSGMQRAMERIERTARELEDQVSADGGPVLRIDPYDRQAAIVELTAAVEAMR